MTRIFVTGGTGFIAAHLIDILLEHGHSVVTSVRSAEKGENVLKHHPEVGKDKLDYVIVKDVADPTAFDEVIKSDPPFESVIHTSSPFHFNVQDTKKDLLDPAIIGTTGILKAIKKSAPTVKRVVITSSFAAIVDGSKGGRPGYTYSEKDWNPVTEEQATSSPMDGYRASKTFAEKAAWDFLEKEKPGFTISTMCPPLVFGPVEPHLQTLDNLNTSNQRMATIMTGKAREEIPPSGNSIWVDVRDLGLAHMRAAERPAAENKRFFITAGYFSNQEICKILRENFPDYKDKLPAEGTKGGEFPTGGLFECDNSRSREILGIQYRSLKDCIVDTGKSLQAMGA